MPRWQVWAGIHHAAPPWPWVCFLANWAGWLHFLELSSPAPTCCAGNLFAAQLASNEDSNTTERAQVLNSSGERPITVPEAAEAAAVAYRRAVQALRATRQPTVRSKRAVAEAACKLQRRACDALQQAAQAGASPEQAAAVEQCAQEVRALGCAGGAKHEEL